MKHIYHLVAIAALAAYTLPCAAQSAESDSVPSTELQEVVVQGVTRRIVKFGAEYTPDKKVKKAATDATRLLALMQLPQLKVSPVTGDIRTLAGKDVSLFIDYVPASKDDLEGMRTEDVLRVEVLDYPDDPRFNSAAHVVNFIMRKYEWGGYTKFTARGTTLGEDRGSGQIYSKFVRGKWSFDASANGSGSHNDKFSSRSEEVYRDVMFGGNRYPEVKRHAESGDDNLRRGNYESVTVRAAYSAENTFIQHLVWFSRNEVPYERIGSAVTFSPGIVAPSQSLTRNSQLSLTPGVRGYYRFDLPEKNTLSARWSFSYGATKRFSRYTLGDLAPIVNNNREKVYECEGNIGYTKKFNHDNSFRTTLMTFTTAYDTHYYGNTADRQKLLSSENMLFLEYMQNWGFGLSLYSRVGMSYVLGRVNGHNTLEQWNPRLGAQLQWKINAHHSASIEGWWGNSHPQPSTSSTVLVRSNELMWLQGNPDLRNTIFNEVSAAYNFIPCDVLSLSAQIKYERNGSKQAYTFTTLPEHDGLVRKSINSGTAHILTSNVGANVTLLNNSLIFGAQGNFNRTILTGIDATAATWFSGSFSATGIFRNLSASLFYETPQRQLDGWTNGSLYKYGNTYGVSLGYSAGNFKGELGFYNWFESDGSYTRSFTSGSYSIESREWMNQLSRFLTVSLTYTIPYGKKVNRNNELGQQQGAGSAILK